MRFRLKAGMTNAIVFMSWRKEKGELSSPF